LPDENTNQTLLLGHSPDPDDAFMFYGLATGLVDPGRWRFEHVLQDIQTLNERALRGELHITAISIHAYPFVADKYALLNCGASMGDGYGPLVVARQPMNWRDLRGKRIAVPGTMTSAFLALSLLLGKDSFEPQIVVFDQILDHVAAGRADAGLIIHEGQLTYRNHDLHCIVDLGVWWQRHTDLPLPLGGNVIRRDLGPDAMSEIAAILERSIRFSLDHRDQAVEHALAYARDMGRDLADRFVGMYVNHYTLDYGDDGREAVCEFLQRGRQAGLVPDPGPIEFV
jgi:1,4-dihydroxy-6-naphthoate synthase